MKTRLRLSIHVFLINILCSLAGKQSYRKNKSHDLRRRMMSMGAKQDIQSMNIIHDFSHWHRQTGEDKAVVVWVVEAVCLGDRVAKICSVTPSIAYLPKRRAHVWWMLWLWLDGSLILKSSSTRASTFSCQRFSDIICASCCTQWILKSLSHVWSLWMSSYTWCCTSWAATTPFPQWVGPHTHP